MRAWKVFRRVCERVVRVKSDKLRDMERPNVLGHDLDRATLTPLRERIDTSKPGDYGADPLRDGTFRMVPSGDVVSMEEKKRRLAK